MSVMLLAAAGGLVVIIGLVLAMVFWMTGPRDRDQND